MINCRKPRKTTVCGFEQNISFRKKGMERAEYFVYVTFHKAFIDEKICPNTKRGVLKVSCSVTCGMRRSCLGPLFEGLSAEQADWGSVAGKFHCTARLIPHSLRLTVRRATSLREGGKGPVRTFKLQFSGNNIKKRVRFATYPFCIKLR